MCIRDRLNPVDAENIRTQLTEQFAQTSTRIVEDREITPGGCMLQAGPSEVDATIETRWKRVLEAIGTEPVSYTHLRAHETVLDLVCRLLLAKKKTKKKHRKKNMCSNYQSRDVDKTSWRTKHHES